jgi:heme/copper-type cytochrome/quinol oxidase subunit 3
VTAATEILPASAPRESSARETGWWGMVLLIATEAALFGYLLFSYFYVGSMARGAWPPGGPPGLHLALPNTLLLLASSATMWWAESGIRAGERARLGRGLLATLILGGIFLTIQGFEYSQTPFRAQTDAHGSLFYVITGFHSAHVAVGLVMLAVVLVRTRLGHFRPTRHLAVTNTAWYWHFVDVVWLAVFTTLYLSPRFG